MQAAEKRARVAPPVRIANKVTDMAYYEERAKFIVRGGMNATSTSYAALAAKLRGMGVDISDQGLANKIARGTFSAGFMLLCLDLMDSKIVLDVDAHENGA